MKEIKDINPGPFEPLQAVLRKWQSFQKLEWWDYKDDAPCVGAAGSNLYS
jgi:hypothetical protein